MELAQTDYSYCAATTPARDVRDATLDTKEEENAIDKGAKSPISEFFPWVPELKKMCRIIYEDFNTTSLIELMRFYVRNITNSISECYTKPSWAIRLKESISETLVLFLYIYRALSEKCDRYIYLNYMSDLLAIYIDMELKASRKTKEDQGIICARITSCLHVYLEHSIEHLLDTLIKVQFMCRSYHAILDPIVTKVIRSIPTHPESSVMYVRYLLIYRLWRKINGDAAARSKINAAAIAALGPPPTFPCSLDSVLPKVPKHQPNPLKFLLFRKFDTKRTCELFVQFCKRNERIYQEEGQQAEEKKSATPSSSDKCDNTGKVAFLKQKSTTTLYSKSIIKEESRFREIRKPG